MKPIDLCEAGALRPFVNCMQQRGLEVERYLEQQWISPAQVDAGEGKIIKRQAWKMFQEVQRREGLESLGFLEGDSFSVDDLGELGSILRQSPTLQDAIDTFSQLIPSFAEGNTVWLERGPVISWLCCRTDGLDLEARVPDHFTIVVLSSLIRMAAGPRWRPEKVRFQSAFTRAVDKVPLVGDLESQFEQVASAVAFRTELLARPIGDQTKLANPINTSLPGERPSRSLGETLRHVLLPRMTDRRFPSSAEAAEILGVSRSTLSRTLSAEGSSYRKMIERVRFEVALELLKDSCSLKEIAHELGYSGANNFSRAFLRMSGFTPGEFRKRHLFG